MRNILTLVMILVLITLGVQIYYKTYNPCDTPLTYKIGIVDPKFKLTNDEVIENSEKANDIFKEAYGRELFIYNQDEGELTINFIFDERSELNANINTQINRIDEQNASLQQKIADYEEKVKVFEKKLTLYNTKVQEYNSQGGAPPDVYDQMNKERLALQSEANALNKLANDLNVATKNYNLNVGDLNDSVTKFNNSLSQKPEEGIYDPSNDSITIFFVNDNNELVHTIAHEFGHSLGMGHVSNSEALMYPMSSNYLSFTTEDKNELDRMCADIPAYEYWIAELRGYLFENLTN